MKISELKKIFTSELESIYDFNESHAIFYEILYNLEHKTKTDELLGYEVRDELSFLTYLKDLKKGRPLQYILGFTSFYGLDIKVNKNVLIPRPETEELVNWIINENSSFTGSILDVGTGSGCIALALKSKLKICKIDAIDISNEALKVARNNAITLALDVCFKQVDFLNDQIFNSYDIIVSNPPYIGLAEKSNMHKNVLEFEPHLALFVDDDVLIFYKKLAELGKNMRSVIYAEISEFYFEELGKWLQEKNFIFEFRKDLNNKVRFIKITPQASDK